MGLCVWEQFSVLVSRSVGFLLAALGLDLHPCQLEVESADMKSVQPAWVIPIFFRGAGVSMGSGDFILRRGDEMLRSEDEWESFRDDSLRCRLITEVRVSTVFQNRAETRAFYSAGFLSDSGISSEPVVFSRATHRNT